MGAISRDFSTNFAQQCKAFSRAPLLPKDNLFKNIFEKLKAAAQGAGIANDICIKFCLLVALASMFRFQQSAGKVWAQFHHNLCMFIVSCICTNLMYIAYTSHAFVK